MPSRYWRFNFIRQNNYVSLAEIEIIDPATNLKIPFVGTISASSQYSSWSPDRLFNGTAGSYGSDTWANASSDVTPWVQIISDVEIDIKKLKIYGGGASSELPSGFFLQRSDDNGVTWVNYPTINFTWITATDIQVISYISYTVSGNVSSLIATDNDNLPVIIYDSITYGKLDETVTNVNGDWSFSNLSSGSDVFVAIITPDGYYNIFEGPITPIEN